MTKLKEVGGNRVAASALEGSAAKKDTGRAYCNTCPSGAGGLRPIRYAEMEAGKVLIAEAAKRAADTKKELEKEQKSEDKKRDRDVRDTPKLSKQSRWFGIEGKILKESDGKWVLEMEGERWEAFLNWTFAGDTDISRQLRELSQLYLALLEAVLTYTTGEEQAVQISRLEAVLAEKLNLLLETNLKDLMELLWQAGQTDTMESVKSSVYKQVTGKTISLREANHFFARGKMNASGGSRFFMPVSETTGREVKGITRWADNAGTYTSAKAGVSLSEEGILYKPSGGGNVKINQEFDLHRKSGELQISQRTAVLNSSDRGNLFFSGRITSFTGRELSDANRFARSMNGSGNLLKNPAITAENDEVRGFLSALTSVKGQIYAAGAGRENTMRGTLRTAINQIVDYYLTRKGAYKVYYYTTSVYERTKSPQKTFEEGLEYAYRLFMEKKGDAAYRTQAAYAEQAGFFHMLEKGQLSGEDLRKGILFLEKNWREFLQSIGEDEKKGISLAVQRYSPWGILLEAEGGSDLTKEKRKKIMLAEMLGLAALGIVYLFYRLFFG